MMTAMAVHLTSFSNDAMASKSIDDYRRYQRTIEDLQNRLAATEVHTHTHRAPCSIATI
jgi:hypothetical protein